MVWSGWKAAKLYKSDSESRSRSCRRGLGPSRGMPVKTEWDLICASVLWNGVPGVPMHVAMCEVLPGVLKFTAELWHTWQQFRQGSARNGPRNRISPSGIHDPTNSSLMCVIGVVCFAYYSPLQRVVDTAVKKKEKRIQHRRPIQVASHRMSTKSPTPNPDAQPTEPSFFPTCTNLVRAPCLPLNSLIILLLAGPRVCGYGSGNGRCALHELNPLDLLKVKFQVPTCGPVSDTVSGWHCVIYTRMRDGGGFIAVLDRTSLVTRVVGDFTSLVRPSFIPFVFYSHIFRLLLTSLLAISYRCPLFF